MAEIASVFQQVNVGVESSSGTPVAANKRLTGLMIQPQIKTDIKKYRATGHKFATVATLNKEWVEAAISGPITYTEIVYLLSGILGTAVISGAGAAKTWTFAPATSAADAPKTFTVEWGDATRALEFAYGLVNSLKLSFSRDGCELSGSMLGQAIDDAITLTSSPTAIALLPVFPTQVAAFVADTAAGLAGASALTRVVSAEWEMSDRYNPGWFLNGAADWGVHIEREPKLTAKLKMEKDAAGMGLLTQMRAGTTKFLRIQGVGDAISGGGNNTLTVDIAGKVTSDPTFSEEEGIECIEWNLEGFHDATWAKATSVVAINELTAL